MADETSPSELLGADTQVWLAARNGFRTFQADALIKGYDPDAETQGSASPACEKELNDSFALVDPNPYETYEEEPGGFPSAGTTTEQLLATVTEKRAYALSMIPQQLQINLLESFRRMHLAQKQRRKHLVRHWQEQALQESKSQELIARLLMGQEVGKTAGTAAT